jgi:two-component system KDP operon response regulator KdpE
MGGAAEPKSGPSPLVLLIEDEGPMRKYMRTTLASNRYRLIEAERGREGIEQARAWNPDLVVLDLGLPDMDGIEVTRALRDWSGVPIVIVSARGQEADKINALDAGADDYLTKPFSTGELLARLRAAMRRTARTRGSAAEMILERSGLRIDLASRIVSRDGAEVHLTPLQFKLLAELAKNAGIVVTQRQLLLNVWGPGHGNDLRYLRVFMAQLRRKLEEDSARPKYLLTEPGIGYRLKMTD